MVVRVGTASGASSILSCDICFTYIVASVLPPNALGFLSFASCVSKQRMVKPDAVYTQSEREKEREREREKKQRVVKPSKSSERAKKSLGSSPLFRRPL